MIRVANKLVQTNNKFLALCPLRFAFGTQKKTTTKQVSILIRMRLNKYFAKKKPQSLEQKLQKQKQLAEKNFFAKKEQSENPIKRNLSLNDFQKKVLKLNFRMMLMLLLLIFFSSNFPSQNRTPHQIEQYQKQKDKQIIEHIKKYGQNKIKITINRILGQDLKTNSRKPMVVCHVQRSKAMEVQNLQNLLIAIEQINPNAEIDFNYQLYAKSFSNYNIKLGKVAITSAIFLLIFTFIRRNKGTFGRISQVQTKKFKAIQAQNIKTKFADVAGLHEAKKEFIEFVDFLKQPERYHEMGARIPKGALLTGPPGTGKTLLARACAGEADVPFFYVSGSEFVEKYVGLGANRIRSLFKEANKVAPSVIFIDELDAIGKKRDGGPFSNDERDNTLNQLLVCMDGFDTTGKVIVMGATNLKESLDPALLRPGRFDRSLEIQLPNFDERKEILVVHLLKILFNPKYTIEEISHRLSILTPGFSGAELANICNEAAILAARGNQSFVDLVHFEKATERVMAGLEKRNIFTAEQRIVLAYYQAGKAVVAWFTEAADPVIKLSLLPFSKKAEGYSHRIKEELPLLTRQEIMDRITCELAGRAAEKHFCGEITTHGENDIEKAKSMLKAVVTKLGMGTSLPMRAYPDNNYTLKPCSEHTERIIDSEIETLTLECRAKATSIVEKYAKEIELVKERLLIADKLAHTDLKELLGARPFTKASNYSRFIQQEKKDIANDASQHLQPVA